MEIKYSEQLQSLIQMWDQAIVQQEKKAQYTLASLYIKLHTKSTDKMAFNLYKKSAKQRYTDAMFALGVCYEEGKGITKNYYQAFRWYMRADGNIEYDLINNPDPIGEAAEERVRRYFEDDKFAEYVDAILDAEEEKIGNSFEADQEAAWSGDAEAQNRLGHRYFHGDGTERDIIQAIHWYRESAKGGCEAGMLHLVECYESVKLYRDAAKWSRKYVERRIKWRNRRLGW